MRPKPQRVRLGLRGIALILTLFTVAVLITLSTSFAILAFNESRSSRSDKDGKLAYEFATAGVDALVSYMGANINWSTNSTVVDPVIGQPPSYTLVSPSPISTFSPWPGVAYFPPGTPASPVEVPLAISTSAGPGPSGVVNPAFTWSVQVNGGKTFAMDSTHDAAVSLVIQRAGLPGDADSNAIPGLLGGDLSGDTSEVYLIQSTASVFATGTTSNPSATRTVVARVRQSSSTDNSLLIQASTFFDVPGLAKAYNNITAIAAQNAINANFASLENIGGIPFGDKIQGQVTVLNVPSNSPFNGQAGFLKLFGNSSTDFTSGNISSGNITKFGGNVAVGQGQAGLQFPDLGAPPAGLLNTAFQGGNSLAFGNQLPGSESGSQPAVTQFNNSQGKLQTGSLASSPMITIDSSSPNSFGTATPLAVGSAPPTQPTGKDIEVAVDANGNVINGSPPGIANIKVTLNSTSVAGDPGTVTISKVGAYSGAPVPFGPNDFPGLGLNGSTGTVTIPVGQLQQLNGGLLYIDGGNVQVNAVGNGDIGGRLSIVAGSSSQRPTVDATDPTNPGLVMYEGGTAQTANATNDATNPKSIYLDPADNNFIGSGTAKFPFQDNTGRWHWPAYDPNTLAEGPVQQAYIPTPPPLPQSAIDALLQHDDATTREGNLTITSSIQPGTSQQPSLGLMAQNYILLSDQTNPANNTLNVDATLQSFAHSVEWAGFLNGIKVDPNDPNAANRTSPSAYFIGMASGQVGTSPSSVFGIPAAPNASLKFSTEAAAGHFNLTGSVISPFIDVEGTFNEGPPGSFIGYPNQTTQLDVHAQNDPPPFLPNFNHDMANPANGLNPMKYVIENITDLGAPAGH